MVKAAKAPIPAGKPRRSPAAGVRKTAPKAAAEAAAAAVADWGERNGIDFPLVGIGCSAGGLEALEKFLGHVPANSGMAFIIVQHLDPVHASALPELLQRVTPMVVSEAQNRSAVCPNCVYVIPPNKDLSLLHGSLHLLDPASPRGLRLPIDFFFRTLAEDQREHAIAVVLSGMGSDGVLGLRAIKEKGGLALVQEPASAKADSMPRSAIEAGLADIVALPEQLAGRIAAYTKYPALLAPAEPIINVDTQSALERIIILLRNRSGNDFSLYKSNTLYRRIERRIAVHQIDNIAGYVRYLRENPQELDLLFRELLIGVTSFFRDPAVWDLLGTRVIPSLLAPHADGAMLRAWVPACSSGEEAYSLAIAFREAVERFKPEKNFGLQIYATDLDADAIDRARRGVYPGNIAADVTPERLARHFVREGDGYRISKDIREMVVFAPQNIITDPPFTKLDLITCRNLLIYFGPQLQKKLLPLFHYALNRTGVLVLGSAETVGNFGDLFKPLDNKSRIFQRTEENLLRAELEFPIKSADSRVAAVPPLRPARLESLEVLTDQLIQQSFAPPAVLVNSDGDILYFSGRTGKYLEPAAGKANINIYSMARGGLREALVGVIRKALRQSQPVRLNGLQVGTNGGTQIVNLVVQGIEKPEQIRGRVLIVFNDVDAPLPAAQRRKSAADATQNVLAQELQQTREALQVTHEEMQTSVEELKSANEELQSTNEELQSTNEELTTSKEEMQSLNEELQTVNAELQSKVDDLTWVRNDMTNLLNSTEIATVFLDNEMNVRRFTAHISHLFKLIPGDVGRPLAHIVSDLDYPGLKDDAQEVLRTLIFRELAVSTHDGRWYRVRIMPYRTQENVIDGVVITFIDITEIKMLEARLKAG